MISEDCPYQLKCPHCGSMGHRNYEDEEYGRVEYLCSSCAREYFLYYDASE